MKLFMHQIAMLSLLMIAFLIQIQIVYPIESWLHEGTALAAGSLMFLPHGACAICAALSGLKAAIPLIIAMLIPGFVAHDATIQSLFYGLSPVLFLLISVILINLALRKPIFDSLSASAGKRINLLYAVLITAALSSLLNISFASIWFELTTPNSLPESHFLADMLGTAAFIGILVMLKAPLVKTAYFLHRRYA